MSKATLKPDKSADPNQDDNWVDDAVFKYLEPGSFKSFFLFAGAGSGKTRTLVNVLAKFKANYGHQFRLGRKKVAIITYTNAAADEIVHRLDNDPIFQVSTIHSFAWQLISTFTTDIKKWLTLDLSADMDRLEDEQSRSKNLRNKTSIDRAKKIESKRKRLETLKDIRKFVYSPSGDNSSRDSLNHAEVISMAADFIASKPLMQQLLVSQFPVILIDESQDTKKELIDALFALQQAMPEAVSLGLFGDIMQRIYADGKENLQNAVPPTWEKPVKKLNHRSGKRIIRLINSIREDIDTQVQQPRVEKPEGTVRLFISSRRDDKKLVEEKSMQAMARLTGDSLWNQEGNNVKVLILEHHMAASRMEFLPFFEPLYKQSRLTTGILDGTLAGLTLLTNVILPMVQAYLAKNQFEIARILKKYSPLFSADLLKKSADQEAMLEAGKAAAHSFLQLWDKDSDPLIITVLEAVAGTGLFVVPESIRPVVSRTVKEKEDITASEAAGEEEEEDKSELHAWEQAFTYPFSLVEKYSEYLSKDSKFGTHQGVKGLEFPRVMVIIDDEEAKGFMFSYDKLFGAKELSATDQKNIDEGKETGLDRTRRLFYVACSRAKDSLAIIAYADNPSLVKKNALSFKWFDEAEIEIV